MKVACDCHVSKRAIDVLSNNGFDVVYWARDEHDEFWFHSAIKSGAEIFVSADIDIENLALNSRCSFVRLPQNKKSGELVQFILSRLIAIQKIEKLYKLNPEMVFVRR